MCCVLACCCSEFHILGDISTNIVDISIKFKWGMVLKFQREIVEEMEEKFPNRNCGREVRNKIERKRK